MNLREQLGKRIIFFDGGMGALLQQKGLAAGELPECWNFTHEQIVADIHAAYAAAGADIIKTNTFGANPLKLKDSGYTTEQVVAQAVSLVRRAAGESVLVAMDIGPTGKLLRPLGDLDFEEARDAFAVAAAAGEKAGADLILIETMSDAYECKAAVLAAKEATNLPVIVTMIVDERGKLLTGGDIPSFVAMLEGLRVDAIGLNCGFGPDQVRHFLPKLMECCSLPVVINPNAGMPRQVEGRTVFDVGPQEFAGLMRSIAQEGPWLLGGCCGTTPEHIAAMVAACRDIAPAPLIPKRRTVVSSYAMAVEFGKRPLLIGERINPTGKKRLKQALLDNDMDYLLREAIAQQQNGAHILDVNVGLPGIDEAEMMRRAVMEIQGVVDLPLQIDTSNTQAMEGAMRRYNGKALINSVNGKQESMHAVFPLVRKYGGVVVALTLDEGGIPEGAQERVAIAEKIIQTAVEYGIERHDIIVDPLAMTISAGQQNAGITLEALRLLHERGIHTSLGVSNISFGLPRRELINAAFFTMALQNGLSAAIVNPGSAAMMEAYDAFCALSGADENCMEYIGRHAGQKAAPAPSQAAQVSLYDCIVTGLKDSARQSARALLKDEEPLAVIQKYMVPALDAVGKDFERGTLFLPQLLMSAEAAKAAFEVIRQGMSPGEQEQKKDKIILATVKGDIHDIGKNIVKVLLENYGYDVVDLGKDVPPQAVVDAALEHKVKLVGLSALMTTTVVNMEETIALLRAQYPACRIMVGGAVLTQDYARQIHADFYSKDAMGSVHYAQELFAAQG